MTIEWHILPLEEGKSFLRVSNPEVELPIISSSRQNGSPLPLDDQGSATRNAGISYRESFLGNEEVKEILDQVRTMDLSKEGFEQKRRSVTYSVHETMENHGADQSTSSMPCFLGNILKKLGKRATHVSIIEYFEQEKYEGSSGDFSSHYMVTTFESLAKFSDEDKPIESSYFAAYIPLQDITHHVHKPCLREPICWRLESNNHQTDLYTMAGSLLMKEGEFLDQWRGKVQTVGKSAFVIKISKLPDESKAEFSDNFGCQKSERQLLRSVPMPSLDSLLTILITTSPIRSNPSTEVIERIMETFTFAGEEFLSCPKVIICDGYRRKTDNTSKRHGNIKQAMRNGLVNDEQAENYLRFKENLKLLCANSNSQSPFYNTIVEELDDRHGYGFALRHALRNCVHTKFVCVVQHDRTFMRKTPVKETVHAMLNNPGVKYVGMSMRSNLMYRDIFLSKYGKRYQKDFNSMVVRPPELCLAKETYGLGCGPSLEMDIRDPVQRYISPYEQSNHGVMQQKFAEEEPAPPGKTQLSLIPTMYWYDNIHIVDTAHYRDFIFEESFRMVSRGGFVEDKCSPVLIKTLERLGLREGHARFGCYILDDGAGVHFTGHLDGGTYLTKEQRETMKQKNRKCNT